MSIGGVSDTAERAVQALSELGVVTVCSSGNYAGYACRRTFCKDQSTICVGAHAYDTDTCDKKMYSRSNYGACVDIMAPGVGILSANKRNNNGK